MKKLFLIMFLSGFVCAITSAQDDMYFIPKKTKEVKEKKKSTSYGYCDRDVDEYNRHGRLYSSYQTLNNDSLFADSLYAYSQPYRDTIYINSGADDDDYYYYSRRMNRFDDFYWYNPYYYGYYRPWAWGYPHHVIIAGGRPAHGVTGTLNHGVPGHRQSSAFKYRQGDDAYRATLKRNSQFNRYNNEYNSNRPSYNYDNSNRNTFSSPSRSSFNSGNSSFGGSRGSFGGGGGGSFGGGRSGGGGHFGGRR